MANCCLEIDTTYSREQSTLWLCHQPQLPWQSSSSFEKTAVDSIPAQRSGCQPTSLVPFSSQRCPSLKLFPSTEKGVLQCCSSLQVLCKRLSIFPTEPVTPRLCCQSWSHRHCLSSCRASWKAFPLGQAPSQGEDSHDNRKREVTSTKKKVALLPTGIETHTI